MKSVSEYKFLDKPETLEVISFLYTKWQDGRGQDAGCSLLYTHGCSLSHVFDTKTHESFANWDKGRARLNELYNLYRDKGFKTREELGIVTEGKFHDDVVLNIRKQTWKLYVEAFKQRMCVPVYSN